MTLILKENANTRGDFVFFGTVTMDQTMAISDTPWVDKFSFLQDDRKYLDFPGFEDGAFTSYHAKQYLSSQNSRSVPSGQLRVVSKRVAVRSRPDGKISNRAKQRPAAFVNMKEAEDIMVHHTNSIAPWLSRNLALPDLIASHICEFWCSRPCPLFFFEKGDVCLTTLWPKKGYMDDDVTTVLVARRRAPPD